MSAKRIIKRTSYCFYFGNNQSEMRVFDILYNLLSLYIFLQCIFSFDNSIMFIINIIIKKKFFARKTLASVIDKSSRKIKDRKEVENHPHIIDHPLWVTKIFTIGDFLSPGECN